MIDLRKWIRRPVFLEFHNGIKPLEVTLLQITQ